MTMSQEIPRSSSDSTDMDVEIEEENFLEQFQSQMEELKGKAVQLKADGDVFYKNNERSKAIQKYTDAIGILKAQIEVMKVDILGKIDTSSTSSFKDDFVDDICRCLCNRAACYLGENKFEECIQDCNTSISYNQNFTRSYFRKASALKSLGRFKECIATINEGLIFDPNSNAPIKDRAEVQQCIRTVETAKSEMEKKKLYACYAIFRPDA